MPTFRVRVSVPRKVVTDGHSVDREVFYSWAWERLSAYGLVGIHEGTLLSDEAARVGLETESFTVDAGEAPRERDWIGGQDVVDAELYFDSLDGARDAAEELLRRFAGLGVGGAEEVPEQDWDAEWKKSFRGAEVPPFWRVLPPWLRGTPEGAEIAGKKILWINPGAGFGTGTHETTRLCLRVIGERSLTRPLAGRPVLDFGSGSGILAIGAALLGAEVDAVEIDPLAVENAEDNARLNGVEGRIAYGRSLGSERPYDVVLANILKPILLEFAARLVARLAPGGTLILSGLVDADVAPVVETYLPLLGGRKPTVLADGEWRAVYW